jgi:hypothetical protein
MLEEINKYDYLGTPDYFVDAFKLLGKSNTQWTTNTLAHFFSNRIYKGYPYIDGGIPLLIRIGMIKEVGKTLKFALDEKRLPRSTEGVSKLIATMFLNLLQKEGETLMLFIPQHIALEHDSGALIASPQSFPLKYKPMRNLLLDLGVLKRQKATFSYIINPPFDRELKLQVSKFNTSQGISIEQLKDALLRQEALGLEAEIFVLQYELQRLANHATKNEIKRISEIDVGAGYDIISYNDNTSKSLNRYIEVKSYAGTPAFYWTQNEIEIAKTKASRYYLYLVDRNKMSKSGYKPIVISDPYKSVYSSEDWIKSPTVTYLSKIN